MPKTVCIADGLDWSLVRFRGVLIRTLIERGHRVCTLAPGYSENDRAWLETTGAELYEVPLDRTGMHPVKDLRYLFAMRRTLQKIRPDILLTYTVKPGIWGTIAAASCGVRAVTTVTGLGLAFTDGKDEAPVGMGTKILRKVVPLLYRFSTRFNEKVIFQNPDDSADFIAFGCIADTAKVMHVNGSGVDLEHFTPAPLPPKPSFLMISRLMQNKGVREYVGAALELKQKFPEVPFRILGWIDSGPDAIPRTQVEAWIEDGLEYLPTRDDVRPIIEQAQVVVLPSYREGTPRAVLEAMAMGRPVIVSDAPGCRQTVEDGVNGFLVPVQNTQTLKERMEWVIANQDLIPDMGAASLARAQNMYDVNKVVADIIEGARL